nr:RNA recognition motif domain containing protein [Haemonchus contortus]
MTMGLSNVNDGRSKVGNLPYQATEQDMGNHFSQAGQVTNVKIVYDRETGRMKGFGFCEFSDAAGANNAVNTLNGADFGGRQLRVNYANKN